jgi:hypothetical protein
MLHSELKWMAQLSVLPKIGIQLLRPNIAEVQYILVPTDTKSIEKFSFSQYPLLLWFGSTQIPKWHCQGQLMSGRVDNLIGRIPPLYTNKYLYTSNNRLNWCNTITNDFSCLRQKFNCSAAMSSIKMFRIGLVGVLLYSDYAKRCKMSARSSNCAFGVPADLPDDTLFCKISWRSFL